MIFISTSLTVSGHHKPRFHVEAWLPFRNCEMVYYTAVSQNEHNVFTSKRILKDSYGNGGKLLFKIQWMLHW